MNSSENMNSTENRSSIALVPIISALEQSISVVIPNYNGRKLLQQNLSSVLDALALCGLPYEIIIVDDASTDDSCAFLEKQYPDIVLLRQEVNQGFAPTVNKGIEAATKTLTFVLNSDVQLVGDYFTPQLPIFEQEETFGVCGQIVDFHNLKTTDTARFPKKRFFKIDSTQNYFVDQKGMFLPTYQLSGANTLARTSMLKKLGGYDLSYAPFYGEDLDLTLKAWQMGWRCYYLHDAICKHETSSTILQHHKKQQIKTISMKNTLVLYDLHFRGWERWLYPFWICLQLPFRIFVGHTHVYKGLKMYLQLKTQIKKSRSVWMGLWQSAPNRRTLRVVEKNMMGEIEKCAFAQKLRI